MSVVSQSPPVNTLSPRVTRTPVVERIALNILATLGTITKSAGYSVDALPCRPNPGVGDSLANGRMMLFSVEPQGPEEDRPQLYTQWLQEFYIACEVVESETSATSIDARRNQVRADVEFALCHDTDLGTRPNAGRGGWAEDTLVQAPIVPAVPANAHEGLIIVVVAVRYRTMWNDPFTSIYDS